jgi:hypothetical protein
MGVISAEVAWWRLGRLRAAVLEQPRLALAFQRLSLYEQLELTFDLLSEPEVDRSEVPSNVVPFRPRRHGPIITR